MIKKLILFLLICASTLAFTQSNSELKEMALRDAQAACDATLKKDFKQLLKYTHPNLLNAAGGAEVMESFLVSTFETMEKDGFKYLKAETKSVSDIVFEQKEFRCFIENYNEMAMNDKKVITTSYMIGTYDSKQKQWYFIEAKEMKDSGAIKSYFPDFKTNLNVPENTMKMVDLKN